MKDLLLNVLQHYGMNCIQLAFTHVSKTKALEATSEQECSAVSCKGLNQKSEKRIRQCSQHQDEEQLHVG
jgi:hypothetical protein